MTPVRARLILLDIEGTTSSVSYVFDVLFPYARKHLAGFLESHWTDPAVSSACQQLARDVGAELAEWQSADRTATIDTVVSEANSLMDRDVKATGLKELQGLIWAGGYASGELKSHLYPDVEPALRDWKAAGLDLRIFSSGSINAQKVFFKNTEYGDVCRYFSAHYDTTTGPKREAASYAAISSDSRVPASEITFLSDIVEELDAARETGFNTVLVKRPGNHPLSKESNHREIVSFDELQVALPA